MNSPQIAGGNSGYTERARRSKPGFCWRFDAPLPPEDTPRISWGCPVCGHEIESYDSPDGKAALDAARRGHRCRGAARRRENEPAHCEPVRSWEAARGGVLDIVELNDGWTIVISEQCIALYESVGGFWADLDSGVSGSQRIIEVQRPHSSDLIARAP